MIHLSPFRSLIKKNTHIESDGIQAIISTSGAGFDLFVRVGGMQVNVHDGKVKCSLMKWVYLVKS